MSNESVLRQAQIDAAHTSNAVWYGEQLFEEKKVFADQINLNADGTNVARTAATGAVDINAAGTTATFENSQASVLTGAGDYFNFVYGGVTYKFTVTSGATTSWTGTTSPVLPQAIGSGTVTITDAGSTGAAVFSVAQTLVAGDTFISATGDVTYTVVSGSGTAYVVTPDTATTGAEEWGVTYVPVNTLSYWDFPTVGMPGVRPIPEEFRIRFGGTGTATAATFQFVRVNALTGAETVITTALATTSAAVWVGVDVTPFGEEPAFNSSVVVNGVRQQLPVDEFVRLVCTAKTTLTTGRTLLVEMGMRRATGPNCFNATP